ncbi:hypothetical protein [Bradyrhizobium japonicum]|uniref:hypothetical protein n=1 Tax=Bradyrhizobium japonicum TaxID=375 RepID=UPI0013748430|nr:hypothetical protein [Bradyrhizobium japonicum]
MTTTNNKINCGFGQHAANPRGCPNFAARENPNFDPTLIVGIEPELSLEAR